MRPLSTSDDRYPTRRAAQMNRIPSAVLFAAAVLIWGTTWHVILYQLAETTPEFGVSLRFALAGLIVLLFQGLRGAGVRLPAAGHAWVAAQGMMMYGLSYLCVYHAERHVPSGLVAVGFSASPLLAGVGGWLLWRTALNARFLFGGALGVVGVALIFWPELGAAGSRPQAAQGLAYTVAAVVLAAAGALVAARNGRHRLPFGAALGWGLLYGALTAAVVMVLSGQAQGMHWPTAASWWGSLLYLSVFGTVLAFAAFLTLQQRLGPGPAATVGVATPVVALAVSTALEGFRPEIWTAAGAVLALAGNVLMLRRERAPAAPVDAATGDGVPPLSASPSGPRPPL